MKHIAIITATPPGVNPGMLACEATARAFVARNGLLDRTTFFRTYSQQQYLSHIESQELDRVIYDCDVGINFEILKTADQLDGFVPIFWGDFLHQNSYHKAISHLFRRGEEEVRELLLLTSSKSKIKKRAISFATSILFNGTHDYFDIAYAQPFWDFFSNCAHVQMRDAISASIISGVRDTNQSCFGIDAAQFLSINGYFCQLMGKISKADMKKILVYFGRGKHDSNILLEFIDEVANALRLPIHWLDWGDKFSFPHHQPELAKFEIAKNNLLSGSYLQNLVNHIYDSKVVLTDTYHLCVVAWALGVPCIMLTGDYHDTEISGKRLDLYSRHDKRKVMMAQDGLMDYFIDSKILNSFSRKDKIMSLAREIIEYSNIAKIHNRIVARARRSETTLLSALSEVGAR